MTTDERRPSPNHTGAGWCRVCNGVCDYQGPRSIGQIGARTVARLGRQIKEGQG